MKVIGALLKEGYKLDAELFAPRLLEFINNPEKNGEEIHLWSSRLTGERWNSRLTGENVMSYKALNSNNHCAGS